MGLGNFQGTGFSGEFSGKFSGEKAPAMRNLEMSHRNRGEAMSDYVAHLQLHMALQARKLVPTLSERVEPLAWDGHRHQLLHQTQVHVEKRVSRQACF